MSDEQRQSYGGQGNLSTQGNQRPGSDRNPTDTLRGDAGQDRQRQQGQQGQADYGSAGQQEREERDVQAGLGSQSQREQEAGGNSMSGDAATGERGSGSGGDGEQYGSGIVDGGFGNGSPSMQEGDAEMRDDGDDALDGNEELDEEELDDEDLDDEMDEERLDEEDGGAQGGRMGGGLSGERGASGAGAL